MQFRISPRQVDGVRVRRRALVGERRKGGDLGAGGAPAIEHMGIAKGKRLVVGDGDALSQRRQGRDPVGGGRPAAVARPRPGQADKRRHVDLGGDQGGGAVEERLQITVLAGLHQTQVAFGQGQVVPPRHTKGR